MPFGAFAPLPLRLGGTAEEGWAPEQHARFAADLVAVKRTARLCRLRVSQVASPPYTAAIDSYHGQNGNGLNYAPALVTVGDGETELTFPAYWTDEFGVQHPLKIRQAIAKNYLASARAPVCDIDGRVVTVRTFTTAGALSSATYTLSLW